MADPNGPEATAAARLPRHPRNPLMDGAIGDMKKRARPKPSPQGVAATANEEEELLQHTASLTKECSSPTPPQTPREVSDQTSQHQQEQEQIERKRAPDPDPIFDDRPVKRTKPAADSSRTALSSSETAANTTTSALKTPDIAAEHASAPSSFALDTEEHPEKEYGDSSNYKIEDRHQVPVSHVTRNESSGSVSSDISSASSNQNNNYADYARGSGDHEDEDDPAMFSPVPKAFVQEVPPAPPSTPASSQASISLDGDGILYALPPLPLSTVQNAQLLEEQQMLMEGAVTPAPHRQSIDDSASGSGAEPQTAGRNIPTLPGEFEDWAVGDRYEMVRILGRGSYGEVAQALDLKAGRPDAFVAIKRIQSPFDQEVDAVRLYREMHMLRHMRGHDCIIQLLNVIQPPTDDLDDFHDLYLVFEYVDTDLYKLIMSPQYLTTQHIQTFLYQMLAGLKYIHSSSVIHRDLKPANILLNEDCSLKICDFGLARIVDANQMFQTETTEGEKKRAAGIPGLDRPPMGLTRQLTKHVVTRWYRAPELILIQPYTSAVDIWSLGCILGELLSMQQGNVATYQDRNPLFPGGACFPLSGDGELRSDEKVDQLSAIFGVIGTPSAEDIASIGKANEYIKSLGTMKPKPFEEIYPAADAMALDLLKQMLHFNPKRRCTAAQAMDHEFFRGVKHPELEKDAEVKLTGPDFLEKTNIDLKRVKQETYDEVLWYISEGAVSDSKPPSKMETNT